MKENINEKLNLILENILELDGSEEIESLSMISYPNWDSLAQLSIISALEDEFSIKISIKDFEMLSSYKSIKNMLTEKLKNE